MAGIETARATLTARRHDLACAFREHVADHACDGTLADDLHGVIRALYWDHATLRMTDLSAATGLPNDRIRRIAGPQVVEVACADCGTVDPGAPAGPQRSPPRSVSGVSPTQLRPRRPPRPFQTPEPTVHAPVDVGWLDLLLDHLASRLPAQGCDHTLALCRRWARREGVPALAVVASLQDMGRRPATARSW